VADDDRLMPGYTKQELAREGLDPKQYQYCPSCGCYWPRRGFKAHEATCRDIVKIDMPPMPKVPKSEAAIMHPSWKCFISALADFDRRGPAT
jgi:hypothetical protein